MNESSSPDHPKAADPPPSLTSPSSSGRAVRPHASLALLPVSRVSTGNKEQEAKETHNKLHEHKLHEQRQRPRHAWQNTASTCHLATACLGRGFVASRAAELRGAASCFSLSLAVSLLLLAESANQIKVALCRCRVNRSSARHCSPARKRTQARHCQVRAGPSSPSRHSTSLGSLSRL